MAGSFEEFLVARVGTMLNEKYRLERLIGSGGMASVYEAVHRNGLRVAVKVLHPQVGIDADLRARFLREGYVANKVQHRGVVRVLDDDTTADGTVFLVMELLEGETLDARWQRCGSSVPVREVCGWGYQLLDVLAEAHDRGIVHRDIKPENVFLTRDDVLKVLDFGIARLREAGALFGATRTGRMIGTPAFMPPEQVLGRSKDIDGQTDLWAVGATMFTLASGQFVHTGETAQEMLVHAGSRHARPIAAALSTVPVEIAAVIDKALAFERDRRWSNARAMRSALAKAYLDTYGQPLPGSRPEDASAMPFAATVLAGAVQAPSLPIAATVDDPSLQRSSRASTTAPAETLGGGTELTTGSTERIAPAAARGISTTAGLVRAESWPTPEEPAGLPSRRKTGPLAVSVGLTTLVVAGGVTFAVLRATGGATANAGGPAVGTETTRVAPLLASTAPLVGSPPGGTSEATKDAGAPGAKRAESTPPSRLLAPQSQAPTQPRSPQSPGAGRPPQLPPQPPTSPPDCRVPYYIDGEGIQRIRPECR
jgi:serine/threonine-protein kinase